MTIDDAIVVFEQVASGDYDSLEIDVRDYERLVKWLTELKLARESAFSDIGLAARAVSENHQLKAENAKLREFIDLKETCWKYVGWCDECPYNGVDDEHDSCICTVQEKIDSLARELGIEVPE